MKSIILVALVVVSFAAVVLSDTGAFYAPEYVNYQPVVETGVRTKRGIDPASLAFLVGVGAGGIFGPIIYNRLYGWKPVQVGWQEPVKGWQEPTKGWEAPVSGGY